MGTTSIYICNNCKNEFKASAGGGFEFDLWRCVKCDRTKQIPYDEGITECNCSSCGGEMRGDISPMCRKCKSRDLQVKEIEVLYD